MLDNRPVEMSQSSDRPHQSEETVFINPKIEDTSFSDDTLCSNQQVMIKHSSGMILENVKVRQKVFININNCNNKKDKYLVKSLPRKVKVGFRLAMATQPFVSTHNHHFYGHFKHVNRD